MKNITKICLSVGLVIGLSLPVIASLPDRKKLTFVGVTEPNTEQHAWNYVDSKSIQRRGKLRFITRWTFWRYKRGNTVASKSATKADCNNWELTTVNFQGVDANGNGGQVHKSNSQVDTSPGTMGDTILKVVCQ